ncbi:MAG: hypothetical protein QOC58_2425, partial [Mycobacterium sp.]|nr:hypothetical protein [Mycobacterium sp.]
MSESASATTTPGEEPAGPQPATGVAHPEPDTQPEAGADAAEGRPPPRRSPWWERHYTFTGTAVGLVFIWFSMTPSLLPRGALFQGLVSGFSGAIGYGLGV